MRRRPRTTKKLKFRLKQSCVVLFLILPLALLWLYAVLLSTITKKNHNHHASFSVVDPMGSSIRSIGFGSSTSSSTLRDNHEVIQNTPPHQAHQQQQKQQQQQEGRSAIIKSPNEKKDSSSSTATTTTTTTATTTTKHQESSSSPVIYYWRYDDASPRIISGRTLQLPSVPRKHRLAKNAIQNITEYALHAKNVHPQREYYFDYNPSIIRLSGTTTAHRTIMHHGNNNDNDEQEEAASYYYYYYYLASFRVSNQNYCFHPEDRQRLMMMGNTNTNNNSNNNTDWLGLALLSANLDILVDGVVNVQQIPGFGGRSAQDFRLFVLPNSQHDDDDEKNHEKNHNQSSPPTQYQIYLSSNDVIVPLWVTLPSSLASLAPPPPPPPPPEINATRIPQVFGKLQAWIRPFVSCAPCRGNKHTCGKNFNYFSGSSSGAVKNDDNNDNKAATAAAFYFTEIWPSPPHLVRAINLTRPCQRRLQQLEPQNNNNNNEWSSSSSTSIIPSFATVEQAWFPDAAAGAAANQNNRRGQQQQDKLLTRGRGSACCIDIVSISNDSSSFNNHNHHHHERRLWMGMEHSKTLPSRSRGSGSNGNLVQQQPNHYLSRLYAFEQEAPFSIVARSGYFCLGFPSPSEQQHQHKDEENKEVVPPLVQVTSWRKLVFGNPNQTTNTSAAENSIVFDCPRIHFVSGMTIDATNSSLVIIAYGVNDCLSRFVRVHLDDLKQLLFTGPPTVVTKRTSS